MTEENIHENEKVIYVSYANIVKVKIICRNLKEYLRILNCLKLNSYEFDECKVEVRKAYTIIFREKWKGEKNVFSDDLLIHNKSPFNENDQIILGKYFDQGQNRYILDLRYDAVIQYDMHRQVIVVYSDDIYIEKIVVDLLREQFVQKAVESNGYYFLKTAAFSYNSSNDVCAFVGKSGSGKTTLLLNCLLKMNGTKYLTNSAAYFSLEGRNPIISWRPHMRIRIGTALQINVIGNYWKINSKEINKKNMYEDFLCLDTYKKICKTFNIASVTRGNLSKIVILNLKEKMKSVFEVQQIRNINEIYPMIIASVRSGSDPAHPDCWRLLEKDEDNYQEIYQVIYNLASKCEVYLLNINSMRIEEIGQNTEKIWRCIIKNEIN